MICLGRTRRKSVSVKKLSVRKRGSFVDRKPSLFVRPVVGEGEGKDWQAVVRKAFATRLCPHCGGALDWFEDGDVSGLRCCECRWGFRHVCDLRSDTCHYEFSIPVKVPK